MKQKKIVNLFLASALALSLMTGCGNGNMGANNSTSETQQPSVAASANSEAEKTDENAEAAVQLLEDLEGTYQELWPVVLADEYEQIWLDESSKIVGDENAEGAYEMMASMVTGSLTGEDAVEAYKDGGGAYCCEFLQDVEQFTFNGNTISGTDVNGKELFNHSYHYIGMEEVRGLYIYESDDADSGEFTYFCIAPDTMETTWHIEFRYGDDLDALKQYDAGKYAYWLGAGISVDCSQSDIENSINLFCTENLSE